MPKPVRQNAIGSKLLVVRSANLVWWDQPSTRNIRESLGIISPYLGWTNMNETTKQWFQTSKPPADAKELLPKMKENGEDSSPQAAEKWALPSGEVSPWAYLNETQNTRGHDQTQRLVRGQIPSLIGLREWTIVEKIRKILLSSQVGWRTAACWNEKNIYYQHYYVLLCGHEHPLSSHFGLHKGSRVHSPIAIESACRRRAASLFPGVHWSTKSAINEY